VKHFQIFFFIFWRFWDACVNLTNATIFFVKNKIFYYLSIQSETLEKTRSQPLEFDQFVCGLGAGKVRIYGFTGGGF